MNRLFLVATGTLIIFVFFLSAVVLQTQLFRPNWQGATSVAPVRADETAHTPANDPHVKRDTLLAAGEAPEAPAFAEGEWVNSDALSIEKLRGRVVLVDFWTFGCYNCRNALPSLKKLHADYAKRGLTIVGVHSPEFEHEKDVENVRKQTRSLGILYPVLTDNNYDTWRAYTVEAWPTVVILDRKGRIRYSHVGEGAYEEQERVVKTLLAE